MKLIVSSAILFLISTFSIAQSFPIGHTTITFNDPTRTGGFGSGGGTGRQIQSEIYYPGTTSGEDVNVASGTFPVLIVGHGFVMAWDAYQNIWEELAPNGYILVFPRTEGSFTTNHEDFGKDLSLCANKMQLEGSNSSSLFFNHILNSTAIIGHSMGGGATMLAASSNSSIQAIVGLAPAETTPSAIDSASNITVPALIMSGSSDGVTPPADHHLPIYNALNSSCKYYISITGGAHCYFANSNFNCDFGESTSSTGISVTRGEQQTILNDYLVKWKDYQLKSDITAKTAFDALLVSDTRITYMDNCATTTLIEKKESTIKIFPNPANNWITVELKSPQQTPILITNVLGEIIIEITLQGNLATIDTAHWPRGTYILKAQGETEKFLKL
ncbi:MAG: T9SS type A sorting domain-containing protein [Crocinitomicaceae bacterium]|nr:T9SS type A sorting domain-containing protein [Crocinitomicaceae bacterium]